MSTGIKILLAVVAVIVVSIVMVISSLIGTYNSGVRYENQIEATVDNNEQILSAFYLELDESVQVTDMYASDFRAVMTDVMQGRYGDDGLQGALATWVNESGVNFDSTMYERLQQIITRNRGRFSNEQTRLVNVRQQYENARESFPGVMFYSALGFPKLDLADPRYNPITDQEASEAFDTGTEQRRTLRRDN